MRLSKIEGPAGWKRWGWLPAVVVIALLPELCAFNFRWLQTAGYQPVEPSYTVSDGLEALGDGRYRYNGGEAAVEMTGLYQKIHNLHLDAGTTDGQALAVTVNMTDEAHSEYFALPQRKILRAEPRSLYLSLQTAGISEKLRLDFQLEEGAELEIAAVRLNARVPLYFSWGRFLAVLALLVLAFWLRPSSPLYKIRFSLSSWRQLAAVLTLAVLNGALFGVLACSNPAFTEPGWAHHQQYQKLAEALADGQLYLKEEPPEELAQIPNPYNPQARDEALRGTGKSYAWDTAYYNGKYYVYFGVVPVLLFYLPYYLLTGSGFPTYIGIYLMGLAIIFGVFFLFRQVVRRWFPKTPFVVYVLICLAVINGCGALWVMADPVFYSMPVTTGLALSMWGLTLWMMALNRLSPPEVLGSGGTAGAAASRSSKTGLLLAGGSLCMALVAGCRPQLLLGAFLAVPLFWDCVFKDRTLFSRRSWKRTVGFCLPVVLVAAGLMAYNAARFGSPFDFGANYNLTTNDMTSRGFRLGRIPLGLYMFLLEPPVFGAEFPFVQAAPYSSLYMGQTIYEAMYGGVLACCPFLWFWGAGVYARPRLREKKLGGIVALCGVSAVIIAVVDAQMAGILPRYQNDFSWLLFLGAALVVLVLYESLQSGRSRRLFYGFLLAACVLTLVYHLLFALSDRNMLDETRPALYYHIKHLVQFWL